MKKGAFWHGSHDPENYIERLAKGVRFAYSQSARSRSQPLGMSVKPLPVLAEASLSRLHGNQPNTHPNRHLMP